MTNTRKIKFIKNYKPALPNINDEIFDNGIFKFNISKILMDIKTGKIEVKSGRLNPKEWYKSHIMEAINKEHLPNVNPAKPILLGEIRPDYLEIIDGNHRLYKAFQNNIKYIDYFKLSGEQLVDYFIDQRGYQAFVEYWNLKLELEY